MEKKEEQLLTTTQPSQPTTLDQRLAEYREADYNVLLPSQTVQKIGHLHEPTVEVVQLDPTSESGDVYVQTWEKDGQGNSVPKDFSLAKPALLKLATCAGIVWDPVNTKRVDDGRDRDYVCYQAVGMLQRSDGRWIPLKHMYELDMDVIKEELVELYKKKASYWNQGNQNTEEFEASKERYVEDMVRTNHLKKRKHKLRLCETGAMMAVIRSLLAIKSHYSKKELLKPFVVPRVVFNPDTSDPDIRNAILTQGVEALKKSYGTAFDEDHRTGEPVEVPAVAEGVLPGVTDTEEKPKPDAEEKPAATQAEQEAHKKEMANSTVFQDAEKEREAAEAAEAAPFAKPEPEAVLITDPKEFKKLKDHPEQIAGALRTLMVQVSYDESLLSDPNIEKWKWEHQEKFFAVLVGEMRSQAQVT